MNTKKSILSTSNNKKGNSKMDAKFNPAISKNKKTPKFPQEIRQKVKDIIEAAQKVSAETHIVQSYNLHDHGLEIVQNSELLRLLPELQKKFREMMLKMPEYNDVARMNREKEDFVLGGFAAFGTPSSVHNTESRDLREWCLNALAPVLRKFISDYNKSKKEPAIASSGSDSEKEEEETEFFVQIVIDRFMYRRAGKETMAETFHRDLASLPKEMATIVKFIFGGWINLDSTNQYFSCIPGTANMKLDGTDLIGFSAFKPNLDEQKLLKKQCVLVEIPPGAIVIFNENIVHEVLKRKMDHDSMRLFLGTIIQDSDSAFFDQTESIEKQTMPVIKSGQQAALYPSSAWMYEKQREHLITWSEKNFKPVLLERKAFKSGVNYGACHIIVPRHLTKGLVELGAQFDIYGKYTETQKAAHIPRKEHQLLKIGESSKSVSGEKRETVTFN